jgi:hypothetical protein
MNFLLAASFGDEEERNLENDVEFLIVIVRLHF